MMKKIQLLLIGLLLAFPYSGQAQNYLYGDVNNDGEVNIADVNAVISAILGNYHYQSIIGNWISEYALDDNDEVYQIPDPIKVSFKFNDDQTGEYGYRYNYYGNIVVGYVDLKWEQQATRLYLWFADGDHEELYYGFNEDGYLLLSLNAQMTQYTAYRPVDHDHPLEAGKVSEDSHPVAVKSLSRALCGGCQRVK